jgi:hypothetical protein
MSGVSYEVRVTLDPPRGEAFERWMLGHHVPQVLATGCFTGARFERVAPGAYRTRYEAASTADLERYLTEHAAALRGDFASRFGEEAKVSRETWTTLGAWPR